MVKITFIRHGESVDNLVSIARLIMVKITFIRHGESVDNLKEVWAGWKDSPLTNHGMKQAEALALSFATTPFTAIHTSNLARAHSTARALQAAQPAGTRLVATELLREQYFGAAEGASYRSKRNKDLTLQEHYTRGLYPPVFGRSERFPGGESKNDMSRRAGTFVREVVMPLVRQEAAAKAAGRRGDVPSLHVAVVSHGLFLAELIMLLWRMDTVTTNVPQEGEVRKNLRGMRNTAWTRIELEQVQTGEGDENGYKFKFLQVNNHTHLHTLIRQRGGISRLAYDPAQKDIRNFFKK